jgi:hypothetical protein
MFSPIFFFFLVPVLLLAFRLFDRLVKIEYERHRSNWEEDGKPLGFFWTPAEGRNITMILGSSWARNVCCLAWLGGTPDWMRNEPKALKMVVWYRVLIALWMMGFAGAFVLNAILER